MDTKIERANKDKVLRKVAKLLAPMGFVHSKPTYFTKEVGAVVEFVHIHKFTFGPKFRAHLGIRVKNDPFQAIALNGPASDNYQDFRSGHRFSLEFQEADVTLQSCADHIAQFVRDIGEPWFLEWRNPNLLTTSVDSPLSEEARSALSGALTGSADQSNLQRTRGLLNLV
jgi:hypothetical protein